METLTINQALKRKNRLVEKIGKLDRLIKSYNSRQDTADIPIDVKDTLDERLRLTNELVRLKTAVSQANHDVQDKIYAMSELKGLLALLNDLPVTSGQVENRYGRIEGDPLWYHYVADIDFEARQALEEKYRAELDALQDFMDGFNATTKIEL